MSPHHSIGVDPNNGPVSPHMQPGAMSPHHQMSPHPQPPPLSPHSPYGGGNRSVSPHQGLISPVSPHQMSNHSGNYTILYNIILLFFLDLCPMCFLQFYGLDRIV